MYPSPPEPVAKARRWRPLYGAGVLPAGPPLGMRKYAYVTKSRSSKDRQNAAPDAARIGRVQIVRRHPQKKTEGAAIAAPSARYEPPHIFKVIAAMMVWTLYFGAISPVSTWPTEAPTSAQSDKSRLSKR